jgi:aryl-alcohol dehydrogenase-like predicted oxidoreductase
LLPKRFSRHDTERGELAIVKYVDLAKKCNIGPSTFANTFMISRTFVTSNVIGGTSIKYLEENYNITGIIKSRHCSNRRDASDYISIFIYQIPIFVFKKNSFK